MKVERKTIFVCDGCDKQLMPQEVIAVFKHIIRSSDATGVVPDKRIDLDFCDGCADKILPAIRAQLALPPKPSWRSRLFGCSHA